MANIPTAVAILARKPDIFTKSAVASAQKIIRNSVLEGREKSRASGVPNLPIIFSYEPAPTFLYGSQVELRSKSMLGDLFGASSYIPVAASTPFPSLLVETWRGTTENDKSDRTREPKLETFDCEYEHLQHPSGSEHTTYVGPGHVAVDVTVDLRSRPLAQGSERKFEDGLAKAINSIVHKTVSGIPTPRMIRGEGTFIPERASRKLERPFLNRIAHTFVRIDDQDDIANLCVILNVEGASSRSLLTAITSPWAALEDMGIEHTTSTSIGAELGDTGHQLGRKIGQTTQLTQVQLVSAVSQCLGYGPPRMSTIKQVLGDWSPDDGGLGGGWMLLPIPDIFFLM